MLLYDLGLPCPFEPIFGKTPSGDRDPKGLAKFREAVARHYGLEQTDPATELLPIQAGLDLEEATSGTQQERPIHLEMNFGPVTERAQAQERGSPARRVRLRLSRVAVCFDFAPVCDPAMKAQHDSRLGRDGEGVPPSIYMETAETVG